MPIFSRSVAITAMLFLVIASPGLAPAMEASSPIPNPDGLKLERAARPWEFISAVGKRAGLLGNEGGRVEAWVYPLKIFRDLRLNFLVEGHVIPAETLARSVIVRPESSTIIYTWDTFSVRETLFVPIDEAGAVIELEVETSEPLEIEATFVRDFQLEWPGAIESGGVDWLPAAHAFRFSDEQQHFEALLGSPTATEFHQEYSTNYSQSGDSSFRLGVTQKGRDTKRIVLAASFEGPAPAETLYRRLASTYPDLLSASARYYEQYLGQTVQLELPDAELQKAYDWAKISMLQGIVDNPFLGKGLIAGYDVSGGEHRPGYAWFFGRDGLWTSLALNAAGDFTTTRMELEFLEKYQRADGKIPHEIAQGASFVPWFKELPYAYAAADATPLYLIAVNDYVVRSGDVEFARGNWDHLSRAYEFLRSTYGSNGLAQNLGVGHGWVEGGPLLPIKAEFYQSGVGVEALHAMASLAHLTGKQDLSDELQSTYAAKSSLLSQIFWIKNKERFAFAVDEHDVAVDRPTVLSMVPLWFGLVDQDKADAVISQLSAPAHQTDWGMRIVSSEDANYEPGGYHNGSVWPLFTGWASVAEYRYHRAYPAYANLRANALLTFEGSLGHVAEVLSGNYFETLATASPHQIWSSAMVVSPLLSGMLGLDADAIHHQLRFAPHVPADWNDFAIKQLRVGQATLQLQFHRTADRIALTVQSVGNGDCELIFSPAISLRATAISATLNDRKVSFAQELSPEDQHIRLQMTTSAQQQTLILQLSDDFDLSDASQLPTLGLPSSGLRIASSSWSSDRNTLSLTVSGKGGQHYDLSIMNASQVRSVDGGSLIAADGGGKKLRISFPLQGFEGQKQNVVLHLSPRRKSNK